jgi:hypothetical protein
VPRLIFLRLRDVPRTDYDLQGLRNHRKLGGLVPYDLPVDGEFQAPRAVCDELGLCGTMCAWTLTQKISEGR